MNILDKLLIYYKPAGVGKGINTLSLSFSRMCVEENTYKQKLIMEYNPGNNKVEEYKIKEFHIGLDKIIPLIKAINFNADYDKPIYDEMHDYILISYGKKKIETSNKNQVDVILDLFKFNDLTHITQKHYQYIKNMYEYVELINLLNSKIGSLNSQQLSTLSGLFLNEDPYRFFQSMAWLPKYLDDVAQMKVNI